MNKTQLADEVKDFILSEFGDGELDLGEAATTVEGFIEGLEDEDDEEDASGGGEAKEA